MTATLADVLHDATGDLLRATTLTERQGPAGGRGRVYDEAQRWRRRLRRLETGAVNDALQAWEDVRGQVDAEIGQLTAILTDATDDDAEPALRRARQHLQDRRDALAARYQQYADTVGEGVDSRARQAARLGDDAAAQMVNAQLGQRAIDAGVAFAKMDTDALDQMVAQLQAGPVRRTLARFGERSADRIADALTSGIATGRNPRVVAAQIETAARLPRHRASTLARTEMLRAYREAGRQGMARNDDVVGGWTWLSAADDRTCAACFAMHGSRHDTREPMAAHPNCRCTLVPNTRSYRDLGVDADDVDPPNIGKGPELFDRLDADTQRRVLGPSRMAAFQDGVPLERMVDTVDDPEWGPTVRTRPARDL